MKNATLGKRASAAARLEQAYQASQEQLNRISCLTDEALVFEHSIDAGIDALILIEQYLKLEDDKQFHKKEVLEELKRFGQALPSRKWSSSKYKSAKTQKEQSIRYDCLQYTYDNMMCGALWLLYEHAAKDSLNSMKEYVDLLGERKKLPSQFRSISIKNKKVWISDEIDGKFPYSGLKPAEYAPFLEYLAGKKSCLLEIAIQNIPSAIEHMFHSSDLDSIDAHRDQILITKSTVRISKFNDKATLLAPGRIRQILHGIAKNIPAHTEATVESLQALDELAQKQLGTVREVIRIQNQKKRELRRVWEYDKLDVKPK